MRFLVFKVTVGLVVVAPFMSFGSLVPIGSVRSPQGRSPHSCLGSSGELLGIEPLMSGLESGCSL